MQQVYTNVTKVLVESKQGSNLLYLPLDKIMQQSALTGPAASEPAVLPGAAAGAPVVPGVPSSSVDARVRDAARTRERETR
jgi:modulator of FtsH protease HflK